MKHRLLNRTEVNRQISETWERIEHISDEDNGRHEAVEDALKTQATLYKQLDLQEKTLPILWEAAHKLNPDNPLTAALSVLANIEKVQSVISGVRDTIAA